MNLKNGDVRVHYKLPERVDMELDKAISAVFKKFGYKELGTGFDFIDEVRDLRWKKDWEMPSVKVETPKERKEREWKEGLKFGKEENGWD